MKPRLRTPALVLVLASLYPAALSAAIIRADNTSLLNLDAAWSGGLAPSSSDVAEWSGAYATAGSISTSFSASTPVSWQGIAVGNITGTAAGLVSVGGSGTAITGSSVTIGTSGIDMSLANQNLVINSATTVLNGATQTWNVATGRNLRFGTTGTGGANANLDGAASTVITVTGGGLVDANQGGATGFTDAAGFAGFNGKWVVNSGATLRGLRHGATAWGTNTASDTITLNGGTLATGGITGAVGNWSWTSNITVSSASTIDNQNINGSGRWLKLTGILTGSAGLTFASTGVGTMSADTGFILTGANTLSGTVTLNSGTFVRVGGLGGTDLTTGVGPTGDLGTASIINNGTLTLSRNNTWTFSNQVSGTGVLRIGIGTGSATHIVTVSGDNSHSGGTFLQSAVTLNVGHANALGTGSVTVAGNGFLDNLTGSTVTAPGGLVLSGGSPTFNGTGDFTFNGAVTVSGANRSLTVNAGTLTLGGAISQDTSARNLTKQGNGNLVLNGASNLTGNITLSAGSLNFAGPSTAGGIFVVNAGTLTVSGSSSSGATLAGGTLVLDYGASDVSKLGDSAFLTLGNGTLILAGETGSHTEAVGSTVLSGSATLLRSGANTVKLALGAITRNPGATLTLPGENFATTTSANVNGILPGITIGGTSLAANDGFGNIVAATSGLTEVTRLESGAKTITSDTAANIRVVDGSGSTPAALTLAASGTTDIANLFNGATGGPAALDLGSGNILRLGAFAFLSSEAGSSAFTISNGTLTAGGGDNAAGDVILANTGSSETTVASAIANNGTGTVSLVKNGSGPVTLSGVNSFTGNVTVNAGTLSLAGGSALADTVSLSLANTAGATLRLNTSETIGGLSGGGTTGGVVNLNGQSLTVTPPAAHSSFNGSINGAGTLIKAGGNQLRLGGITGANTATSSFSALQIDAGLVIFTSTAADDGVPSVTLNGDATSGLVIGDVFAGGKINIASLSGSGGKIRVDWNTPTGQRTLSVTQSIDTSFAGLFEDATGSRSVGLEKNGTGSLTLSGLSTCTGSFTVNAGTLVAASATAFGSGPVSVTAGSLNLGGQTLANSVTIGSSGSLTGSGTLSAPVTLNGTLTPGGSSVGLVSLSASPTLSPSSRLTFQIASSGGVRGTDIDALDVAGALALDGTVTVTLAGLTPAAGQQFDLINSTGSIDLTNFNLATDLVLPALAPNLLWNTSAFASDGVVSIQQASLGTSATIASFAENAASPASVVTVSVPVAPLADLVVTLTPTANGSEVSVPATVTILAGQTTAAFNVSAVNDGVADGDKVVSLSLSAAGYTSGSLNLTVTDVGVSHPFVAWQNTKFTAPELADPLVSGNDADPDGDGLSNALEYAFGTEPKAGDNANRRPQASVVAGALALSYRRPVNGAPGVTYAIEILNNLDLISGNGNWNPATPVTDYTASTPVSNGDGTETITITFTGGVTGKKFGRISVTF